MSLFTIGHTNHTHENFIKLLKMHSINYVLDVRRTPYSKFTDQFNKEVIGNVLKSNGINYYYMGKSFGARQEDKALYTPEGYLDFEKTRESEQFKTGLKSVIKGLNEGNNIALMCTEKDPFDCHRTIMVSRGFELEGIEVQHIHEDGHLESQEEINDRLIHNLEKKNKVDICQPSFFEPQKSYEEWLVEAYRLRNKEIGYHIQNE